MSRSKRFADAARTVGAKLDRRTLLAAGAGSAAMLFAAHSDNAQAGEGSTGSDRKTVEIEERQVTIGGGREPIPCVLWTPKGAAGSRPLVLMGHGGLQHKKTEKIVDLAEVFVRRGYAVAAIDQPNHGDRIAEEFRPENIEETRRRLGMAGIARLTHAATTQSVEDWRLTLDHLQNLPEVGADQPVGYYGVSLGTRYGVPFVAAEKRIRAAILGLFGFADTLDPAAMEAAARKIDVPLLFYHQWNDQLVNRDGALALYDALASKEKTLHINPGLHGEIPSFEHEAMERFFARHLERSWTWKS